MQEMLSEAPFRDKVLNLGRRLIYGVAECVTGKGRLLTHPTLTYIHPEK